jgi:hypothetical protein
MAAATAGLMFTHATLHAGVGEVYDNWSAVENNNGTTDDGADAFSSTGIPDSFIGSAIGLAPGTQYITGFDLFPTNVTNELATPTNVTFTAIKLNIYVWGTVNSGTTSASNPAFGDLLTPTPLSLTIGINPNLPPGYYVPLEGDHASSPGIILNTPLQLPSNTSSIGLTVEVQGTTQNLSSGNLTFSDYNGLNNYVVGGTAEPAPLVGYDPEDGWYRNANGETNGNFTSTLRSEPGYVNTAIATDVYGGSPTTYNWVSPSEGVYTTASNWNPSGVPTSIDTAIFNLGSSSPYLVEVPDSESAGSFLVQNDSIQLDLDAVSSSFYVANTLCVGVSPTANGSSKGLLQVVNTGGLQNNVVEAAAIVIGGSGGTGSIVVGTNMYLYSDSDTYIGAGSNLSIGTLTASVTGGTVAKFGTGTLTIAGTTNAWTGQLDIGPSAVDIRNGSIGTVMNQIKTGYNNGKWTGQGITSSFAAADSTHLTAVGAIVNNDGNGNALYGSGTALGLFDGEAPPVNAVLIRYTYFGDANLDGKVDGSDYSLLDNGALNHLTGWQNGDFNYDGVINGSDYTLIDNAYNQQGAAIPFPFADASADATSAAVSSGYDVLASSGLTLNSSGTVTPLGGAVGAQSTAEIAAVPEPASMAILALSGLPMLSRRSRRRPTWR